jgi:hypothetical protein
VVELAAGGWRLANARCAPCVEGALAGQPAAHEHPSEISRPLVPTAELSPAALDLRDELLQVAPFSRSDRVGCSLAADLQCRDGIAA